jgi:lysozyme
LNYPSKKRFPIRGVDVSHHEGDIHWFEASLNGVQFAYLKATEGGDFKDRRFLYNWTQCGYNGIARGAYHYFSFCRPGAEQARNFLSALPGPPELPPALDLEFSGNCGRVPSRADLAREISAFVAVLSRRFAGPPVFYVSEEFYKRYLEGHRQEYPAHRLWIQNVVREPSQAPCGEWVFWQYAHRGRVPGIPGLVDLNVFCGSADEFSQFTRSPTKIELRRAGFAGIVRSSHE